MAATQFAYLPLPSTIFFFLFLQSDCHSSLECSLVSSSFALSLGCNGHGFNNLLPITLSDLE